MSRLVHFFYDDLMMIYTVYRHINTRVLLPPQTNEIQRVTHLNYTGWPDHGTPSQPEQLLTFISYMRHVHRSGPIITHCSAGIGRSGTLICIDVVLGLISKDADVSFRSYILYLFFLFTMITI